MNAIKILKIFWKAIKVAWEFITEDVIPFIFNVFSILFMISLPIGLMINLYEYFTDGSFVKDINPVQTSTTKIVVETPTFINNILGDFSTFITPFIVKYPFSVFLIFLVCIYFFVNITLKRRGSSNFIKTVVIFLVLPYLVYVLSVFSKVDYDSISKFISFLLQKLVVFINPSFPDKIEINIGRIEVVSLTYLLAAYWINSRLLWILSIFCVQIILFKTYTEDLKAFFTDNSEFNRLLQGVIPLIIAAPYVLIAWVFRDNDKFSDYHQKERELTLREKEARMKEKEFTKKSTEIDIKRKEILLKEKEIEIKNKELLLKEKVHVHRQET